MDCSGAQLVADVGDELGLGARGLQRPRRAPPRSGALGLLELRMSMKATVTMPAGPAVGAGEAGLADEEGRAGDRWRRQTAS